MKKILHISDLHFGTERPGIVATLREEIKKIAPDMVIVSGDLTQRAKTEQFLAAKSFLDSLSNNVFCVPGNHDISLHNWVERFFYPFRKYKKYIHSLPCDAYNSGQVAILGINSVTPFKPMGGYVTDTQLMKVKKFFGTVPQSTFKVIVMHHNLIRSERHKIINDAEKLINMFSACHVNLILSGHIHYPCIELLKRDYLAHNMYVITAGTAISTRTAAPNSFNTIELEGQHFTFTVYEFDGAKFVINKQQVLSW
jgi:3',5'-cyclic AMP phosphodiesterase CpdA